ncbi:hypothetical protein [Ochrobactrum soli]|uniref:Uncharacterized protein n=1 Tax=Ochrobactrum soli TaxID=2448455 RepID=A0A849KQ89_9HYPH|nr:hypothetical protein [[Ochrobactrum] soli]NNU62453.1 hypothetical protein [[Ochrobactrum] soli]
MTENKSDIDWSAPERRDMVLEAHLDTLIYLTTNLFVHLPKQDALSILDATAKDLKLDQLESAGEDHTQRYVNAAREILKRAAANVKASD